MHLLSPEHTQFICIPGSWWRPKGKFGANGMDLMAAWEKGLWLSGKRIEREISSLVGYHFLTVLIVLPISFLSSMKLRKKAQTVFQYFNPKNDNIIFIKTLHSV